MWYNANKKVYLFYVTEHSLTRWMLSHELGSLSGVAYVDLDLQFPNDLALDEYAGKFNTPATGKWEIDESVRVIACDRPDSTLAAVRDELSLQPDESNPHATLFEAASQTAIPYVGYGTG